MTHVRQPYLPNLAEAVARHWHGRQRYGNGRPYPDEHLAFVVQVLRDCGFGDDEDLIAAGWLHDILEDTDFSSPEFLRIFGREVFVLVDACSGFGKNRAERNARIYRLIQETPRAAIVKLADRIANVEASAPGSGYRSMYWKEIDGFDQAIRPHVPDRMWARMLRGFHRPDLGPGGRPRIRVHTVSETES